MTLPPKQNVYTIPLRADAQITLHCGRYGIEVQIDSSSGDGSKSCVVMCRGVDRYVTELSVERKQPMYPETVAPQEFRAVGCGYGLATKSQAPPKIVAEPNSPQ